MISCKEFHIAKVELLCAALVIAMVHVFSNSKGGRRK